MKLKMFHYVKTEEEEIWEIFREEEGSDLPPPTTTTVDR